MNPNPNIPIPAEETSPTKRRDLSELSDEEFAALDKQRSQAVNNNGKRDLSTLSDEEFYKLDHQRNNDGIAKAKDPKNELSWADQIVVAGAAFGTAALDRMEKMGSALGRLETAAINKVFGTNFQAPNNEEVRASTTGAMRENLKKATEGRLSSVFGLDARNVGDFLGDVAPTMVVPGGAASTVMGKIGMGALQGGVSGAVYSASETTSNDPTEIGKAAAYGGGVGALFGGASSAVSSAVAGAYKYANNKFVPAGAKAEKAVTSILDDIGKASKTLPTDASNTAAKIINDIKSKDASVIDDLYTQSYNQPISSQQIRDIKSNPALDKTIERYHDKLMTSKSTVNSEIAQNFQSMVERNAKTQTPSTYEYYDTIKKAMDDDIQASLNAGANQNASLLINKQKQLLNILDSESGDYQMARGLAAQKKLVEDVFKDIGVEKMAEGNTAAYKKLATTILDTKMPPQNLETLRDAFVARDPQVWNSVVRTVFENKVNLTKGTGAAKPLEFMEAIMSNPAQRNMLYTALDFPGNEMTKIKLEALGQIYNNTFKTSFVDNVHNAAARSMASLRTLEGSKANEFDKIATQFIFDTKYNVNVNNILSRPNLTRDQKLDEIIKLILPQEQSNYSKATSKILGAKTGELVGSRYTDDEDKK